MTNQTELIREVRAALEAATPGPWKWNDMDTVFSNEVFVNPNEFTYMQIADGLLLDDAKLVANSPTWLQQLTDRLEEAVKALEWYGDPENYSTNPTIADFTEWDPTKIVEDNGVHARLTLKRIKGENG